MPSRYDTKEYRKKRKLERTLNKLKNKNEILELKNKIKEEKRKYKRHIQHSKIVLWSAELITIFIILFMCYEMDRLNDLSQGYSLIGISSSLSIAILGYFAKSFLETKEEKKNELEREMFYHTNPHDEGGNG